MQFVTVRELRLKPGAIWKKLERAPELVVTSKGRPIAVLSPVVHGDPEETVLAIRHARAVRAVARLQQQAVERGLHRVGVEALDTEIRRIRRSRQT
jgi:hypothetical protein